MTAPGRLAPLFAVVLLGGCASRPPPPTKAAEAPKPRAKATTGIRPAPLAGTADSGPVLSDACERTKHPFLQPIAVQDDSGLERYPPVIGFPIAFPRGGNLRSLSGFFTETPNREALATQAEVLSRWGEGPTDCDAPIRWGYFFAAGSPPPKSRAYLAVRHDPAANPEPLVRLRVDTTDARVVVDTGPARFTVQRDWFNGLSKVEIKQGDQWKAVVDVPSQADMGMLVQHRSQLASPLNGKVLSFEVERSGPVVATVAFKGTYAYRGQPQYYRYTLRMHFYAGTAAVQIDHTYYNGETEAASAEGAKNLKVADRVFMRLPLALGDAPVVQVRATDQIHGVTPTAPVTVQQYKRSPDRPQVVFAVTHGQEQLQLGTFASAPFLGAVGADAYAVATIGNMDHRDPQALRYVPTKSGGMLEIDWQSEELAIGGAKGIWSRAALDFGPAAAVDLGTRASQLYAHVTRPTLGVPNVQYLNTTHAYGQLPAALPSRFQKVDKDVDELHAKTVDYLRRYRITGTQIWPDLNRDACSVNGTCAMLEQGFFEGGDNNYWDWGLVELEQFLRTGDPAFAHDFALAEAVTMAETVSFRPNWYDKHKESVFAGLSPCYGTARGWGGPWIEGLTHRTGNCPGDYGYNKLHRLAYILTADRRFTDFFTDGANTAIRQYGLKLRNKHPDWREVSVSRMTAQYIEPLLTAAEFGRIGGDAENRRLRDVALKYFDFMSTRSLQRGHSCSLLGSGYSDPGSKGDCQSAQQWMMPIFVDWVVRLHYLYRHAPAKQWLLDYVKQSTKQSTVLDSDGLPDISAQRGGDGWRTVYRCQANKKQGVVDDSCEKVTKYENQAYYYPNGLLAYLNALAMVGEVDTKDSLQMCKWLPDAYEYALRRLDRRELNHYVWGKSPGQAYAFAQRALGVITACK